MHPVHREKWKRIFHKVAYLAGLAASVATIPQIIKVWVDKDVTGISVLTWSLYLVIAIILGFYGQIHRERLMVLTYVSLSIADALVILGVIIYT